MTTKHSKLQWRIKPLIILFIIVGTVLALSMTIFAWWQQSYQDNSSDFSANKSHETISISPTTFQLEFKESLATVQIEGVNKAWVSKNFVIIDVRPVASFLVGHIKGSLSVPLESLKNSQFDPETTVVLYSNNPSDLTTAKLTVAPMNIKSTYALTGDIDELKRQGYEINDEATK